MALQTQAVLEELERELKPCPRCGVRQKLHQVWIQKKDWGGKFTPENIVNLCQSCDEEWRKYVQEEKVDTSFENLKEYFEKFIIGEVAPKKRVPDNIKALRELGGLRVQIAIEKVRYEGRFRARGKRLDELLPLEKTEYVKRLITNGKVNNWLKFLLSQVAEVKALKTSLDKEIESLLRNFPIWEFYLKHIPGVGPYIGGFLIGTIGSIEGKWCEHTVPGGDYCKICPPEKRTIIRPGPLAFPSTADLWGYAGVGVENGKAVRPKRGEKLNYNPLLKIVVVRIIPQSLDYRKNQAPWSPYSQLLQEVEKKELEKEISRHPDKCYICEEEDVVNLGWKCQSCGATFAFADYEKALEHHKREYEKELELVKKGKKDPKKVKKHNIAFAGYCCRKTLNSPKPHKFFNPAHRQQRVYREVGKKFLSDFWHTWLWFLGQNPDIAKNWRIMTILNRVRRALT